MNTFSYTLFFKNGRIETINGNGLNDAFLHAGYSFSYIVSNLNYWKFADFDDRYGWINNNWTRL